MADTHVREFKKDGANRLTYANYMRRSRIFALSGHWPLSKQERAKLFHGPERSNLRAWWGHQNDPDEPPESLTNQQAATINGFLEQRGWTLVRNAQGKWGLVRLL